MEHKSSFRIDLHTHSSRSKDGGITARQYKKAIDSGDLDVIAVTDHNRIDMAQKLHDDLGRAIIVGEEITTKQGDLVGLFLDSKVKSGLDIKEAIAEIKSQAGLVYIPHPFETMRKGLKSEVLERIKTSVDIVEVINGRAWLDSQQSVATKWAKANQLAMAAGSDSHDAVDLGKTHTVVSKMPTATNLVKLLGGAEYVSVPPSLKGLAAPSINRIQKRFSK